MRYGSIWFWKINSYKSNSTSAISNEISKAEKKDTKPFKNLSGINDIDKIIEISQSPIGRTPRSNPATYTGLFTPLRELFCRNTRSTIKRL